MSHVTQFIADLRQNAPMPELAIDHPPAEALRRFSVYRNNVAVALTEALRAGFPAIEALVGPEFFAAMARAFIRDHPPSDPVMAHYGTSFADWLAVFPPVAHLPYLPDVARIELALRLACHAQDRAALTVADLSGTLGRIVPHPATRCLVLHTPALAAWAQNAGRSDLGTALPGELLISRPDRDVLIHEAPQGSYATLAALSHGCDLEAALAGQPDPVAILSCLVQAGALSREMSISTEVSIC